MRAQTWSLVNSQGSLVQRPFYYTTLGADPTNADVVYAGAEGFFKSVDGGKTFTTMRTPHGDNHDIWISPKDGNTMVQANDGGANVSFDGGRTWSTQMNQPTAEIYGVWLDQQFPYKLYGAQQDNTTLIITSQADPSNADDFVARAGLRDRADHAASGRSRHRVRLVQGPVQRDELQDRAGEELLDRRPVALRQSSERSALAHAARLADGDSRRTIRTSSITGRSTCIGRATRASTWEKISPDLTAKPAGTQGISGEPITRDITGEEFYSTLYAITESPLERGVIWVGSNDGPFHVTRDNGRTWMNVTPKDLPPGGRVQFIEASPHRRGSAYYATYRYLLGDYQPYLYRTDDYGKTWTRLTDGKNGIPADWPTRVVREDPDREGLLYAGTEFGMFISFDNGAHWQSFQLNLPNVPITDIKVHQKDLVLSDAGARALDPRQPELAASAHAADERIAAGAVQAPRRLPHADRCEPGRADD